MKFSKLTNPFFSIAIAVALLPATSWAKDVMKSADSDMKEVLNELKSKNPKPLDTLSAEEARKQPTPADAVMSEMAKKNITAEKSGKTEDIQVSGAAGKIPARIYRPDGTGKLPLIVYYHGGGWVIADKDVYDASARALSKQANAIVLSVDYRQAPEHKFPAAHDDAYAAYKWAVENANSLGADSKRIAIAGESAGGNLAINVAIRARDEKFQQPIHELLIYPVADSSMTTASYKENADAKPLNQPMMAWFMKNYLNSMDEAKDPRINVIAADLKGLPETTIITAQIDPLRSEGEHLAKLLKAAGTKVNYQNFNGVTHEFFGMGSVVKDAAKAQKFATSELTQAFHAKQM